MRKTVREEDARRLEQVGNRLVESWTRGSSRRDSVLLKFAAKEEFGLEAPVWKQGRHKFKPGEIAEARRALRQMYERTQEYLQRQGIDELTLMRGVDASYYRASAVEGWTSDIETARKFAKSDIIVAEVLAKRILACSGGPGWHNGPHGEEWEHIVLGGEPK